MRALRSSQPFLDRVPALLTLGAQGAGATMTDACGIQDLQGPIVFGTSLLGIERMIGWCATRGRSALREQQGNCKGSVSSRFLDACRPDLGHAKVEASRCPDPAGGWHDFWQVRPEQP